MSRTFRRNKKHSINSFVGTKEECRQEYDQTGFVGWRSREGTFEQQYQHRLHWYTRDHRSGRFGVPYWYRRMMRTKPERLSARHQIHLAVRGDLEEHESLRFPNNAKWFWW